MPANVDRIIYFSSCFLSLFFFLQEKCLQEFTKKNEERKNRINEGDSPIILQIEGEI